ncbi:hypothetical protein AB8A24_23605 [Streptomyces sp. BF23-19]
MGSAESCRRAKAGLKQAEGRFGATSDRLGEEERELAALRTSGAAPAVIEAKKNSVELARSARDAAQDEVTSWESMVSEVCEGPDK